MGEALKNVFPRLFSISSNKNAKLSELGSWSNGRWVWGLVWRRPFFLMGEAGGGSFESAPAWG